MYQEALQNCDEAKAAGIESYKRKVGTLTEKLNKAMFNPGPRAPKDEEKLRKQIVEQRTQVRNLEMEANVEFEKLEDDIDELELEGQTLQDELAALDDELLRCQSEGPAETSKLIEAFKKREKEVTPEIDRLAQEVEESYQEGFSGD
jgi:chromosome segregation ATPase